MLRNYLHRRAPKIARERMAYHRARRASRDAKAVTLQTIMDQWPHGAPVRRINCAAALFEKNSELTSPPCAHPCTVQMAIVRRAALQGISVGGVGYGTLQNMRHVHYLALKSALKTP